MNASVCPRRHSSLWLLLFVLLVVPACGAGETSALRKGVPINMAEAIIEPFWVPELSGLPKWRIDPGAGHGLRIRQNWSAVDFEWASKPAAGPALRMSRDFHVDCSAYDRLLVRLSPPKGCVTRVAVATDRGPRAFVSEPAAENRADHRHEEIADHGFNDLAEGSTDDDRDREIDDVALDDELLEACKHVQSFRYCEA